MAREYIKCQSNSNATRRDQAPINYAYGLLVWWLFNVGQKDKVFKEILLYSIIFNIKIPNSIVKFYTKKCVLDIFLNINES